MYKIIEYRCVYETDEDDLNKEINHYIEKGFEPLGPCQPMSAGGILRLVQTLVKYEVPKHE